MRNILGGFIFQLLSSTIILLLKASRRSRALFEAFWIVSLIILSTFKRVVIFASRPASQPERKVQFYP
ncbi:hypothetical protein IMY05_016G0109700 [Salix suchowensis]|nr:hypothetical protein IMY05_016G0109700 [Salix suchowensis]